MASRLEYDSSAFSYFFLALAVWGLAPLTAVWWPSILDGVRSDGAPSASAAARKLATDDAATSPASIRSMRVRTNDYLSERRRKKGKARAVVVVAGWALVAAFALALRGEGTDIAQFNPFEVLGVPEGASEAEIKKAYRKLSLQWHPDRWTQGDKEEKALAESRFVKVAKAHAALTDPIAKKNWELYGNPDGRQALEMSVGLPAFLLEKENQFYVVGCYLMMILVVFPSAVLVWAHEGKRSTGGTGQALKALREQAADASSSSPSSPSSSAEKSLHADTEEILRVGVHRGITFAEAADIVASAAEFRALGFRDEAEKNIVEQLHKEMVANKNMPEAVLSLLSGLGMVTPGNIKAIVLVWAHLNRRHDQATATDGLLDDMEVVLRTSPALLRQIVMHARTTCHLPTLRVAVLFMQYFNQALVPDASPLTQIPGVRTAADVAEVLKLLPTNLVSAGARHPSVLRNTVSRVVNAETPPASGSRDDAVKQTFAGVPFRSLDAKVGTIAEIDKSAGGKNNADDVRVWKLTWEEFSVKGDLVHIVPIATREGASTTATTTGKGRKAWTPFLPHDVYEEVFFCVSNGPGSKNMGNIPKGPERVVGFATVRCERLSLSLPRSGAGVPPPNNHRTTTTTPKKPGGEQFQKWNILVVERRSVCTPWCERLCVRTTLFVTR